MDEELLQILKEALAEMLSREIPIHKLVSTIASSEFIIEELKKYGRSFQIYPDRANPKKLIIKWTPPTTIKLSIDLSELPKLKS